MACSGRSGMILGRVSLPLYPSVFCLKENVEQKRPPSDARSHLYPVSNPTPFYPRYTK